MSALIESGDAKLVQNNGETEETFSTGESLTSRLEDSNNLALGSSDLEKEYDFGSASSHRESDEGSWETVSEDLKEEMDTELNESDLIEHETENECFCNTCNMKSLSISTRIKSRLMINGTSLPDNVTKVTTNDGTQIYVIGTAHFSKASQDDVEKTIQYLSPDVVMVELCASRVNILKYDEESLLKAAQDVNLTKLKLAIKESGNVLSGVMQILLLSMSAHITKQLGMAPGGEFRVAAKQAQLIPGCRLILGDRPIKATLGRAMSALSMFQKMKLGWHLLFSKDTITTEDVEKYKKKDMIAEMLAEMTGDFPELSKVFVDERDQYMAQMLVHCSEIVKHDLPSFIKITSNEETEAESVDKVLNNSNGDNYKESHQNDVKSSYSEGCENSPQYEMLTRDKYKPVIVGVVGIGHMNGIIKNIGCTYNLQELNIIPEASYSSRAFKLFFKSAVVAVFSWSVYSVYKWVRS